MKNIAYAALYNSRNVEYPAAAYEDKEYSLMPPSEGGLLNSQLKTTMQDL